MALTINSGYKSLNLSLTEPTSTYYIDDVNTLGTTQSAATAPRSDIDKLYIWIGTTANFVADNTTLVYEGAYQNSLIIDRYNNLELADNTQYYVRYAITSKLEPTLKVIIPAANVSAPSGTTRDIGSEVGLRPWIIKTSNYTAAAGDRIIANTTLGTFTITLPANPVNGTSVTITDGGNFTLNNLTVARNGSLIVGESKDIKLDILNTTFEFIYTGATKGWDFTATTGPKGDDGIPAELLTIESTGFAFAYEDYKAVDALTPPDITITANKQNIQGNVTFLAKAYDINNVELGTVTLTGTGDVRTLTPANFNTITGVADRVSIKYVKINATIENLSDSVTIYRIDNGSDSVLHGITNESHTVPADSFGVVGSYSGAFTKGYVYRGLVNETIDWTITKTDSTGLTTTLVAPTKISTTGIIGNITGTGPWTATITGMSSTSGLNVGDEISAIENSGGRLYGGTPSSVVVASKTSTSITYTVTGGTTPVAGAVGSIAKGKNEYTLTATNLTNNVDSATTSIIASKDNIAYEKVFSISKSKDGIIPVVIDLSNENNNVATDSNGANGDYSLSVTDVTLSVSNINALPLITNLTLTPSTGVTFNYIINGTTLPPSTAPVTVSLSPAINTLSVGITNLSNVDNGKVTIAATYNNVVYSTEYTVSKTRGGAGGQPAVVYSIESDSEIVYNPNTQLFSPTTVTYSAYSKTGNTLKVPYTTSSAKIRLEYSSNNSSWTTIGSDLVLTSVSDRSITTNNVLPTTAKYLRYRLLYTTNNVDTVLDSETDTIGVDGENSSVLTVDVENDTHQIPFTAGGTATYTYSGTKIQVFDNNTELQYVTGANPLTAGEWTLSAVSGTGITPSITTGQAATGGQKYLTVPQHSALVSDTATITYTITAISIKGVQVTGLLANQTFTKVLRTGVYRIVGATPITKSKTGTFSSVSVSGQLIDGNTVTSSYGYLTQTPNGGSESARSAGTISIQPTTGSATTSVVVKLYETNSSATVLDQAEIKVVNDGADSSAFTIDVINDTHAIPCDSDGTPLTYQYSGSIIQLFENTTELQYVGPNATLSAGQWKITSAVGTGITAATRPSTADAGQKYVTFPDHSAMTTETAKIDYIIQVMTTSGVTVSGLTSNQTFTKLRRSAIFRLVNATPIRVDNLGSVTQATINAQKITAENVTSPFGWITEQLDNGSQSSRVQLTSSGYITTATSSTQQVTIRLFETASSSTILDSAQIKVISNGADAKTLVVDVENDTHQIPFTASGTATYTLSGTKIQVFENTTELQYVATTPANGQWTFTSTTASNITSSINSTASNKPAAILNTTWALIPDHSNLTSDTASISYTIQAKTLAGVTVNGLIGNQTFTKIQRSGVWKIVGTTPITVDSNGTVNNPTLTGQLVDGTTVLSNQGWLTQQVMPGGSESARVQSLTTSATSASTHVIVKLYSASTGGTPVDQAELRVVTSGTSGQAVDIVFARVGAGTTPTITSTANPPSGNVTWSTSPPAGSNPLWSSTGYSNAPYSTWTWDTPVRITGETVFEITAFARSSAATVATPSGGSYSFTTKTLTPPTSTGVTWYDYVPAGTDPVWESRAVITDINTTLTWSSPVRISMSARSLDVSGIVSVLYDPNTSSKFSPSSLGLTAVPNNLIGTVSYIWSISPNTGITLTNTTTSSVGIQFGSGADTSPKTVTVIATDTIGSITKNVIIPIVQSAPNTIDISYTNDSHAVPIGASGAIWTGSGGSIEVFEGQTKLTLNSTSQSATYPAGSGRYNLSIAKISGDTITVGALSGTTTAGLADWSGTISQPTIYRITAYVTTNGGANVTVSTDATLAPVRDGVSYWLTTSASSISKNVNVTPNTLTPSTLTVNLYRSVGSTAPALYGGRFTIEITTDGTTWTTAYTSAADQSSYTYPSTGTISNTIKAIRARAYTSGGTTTLVDEEIITVVNDGANGSAGLAAKGIDFTTSVSTFKKLNNTYTPASATLTAAPQNLTSPTYSWSVSSGATLSSSSGSSVTLTPTTSNAVITVTLTATDNSVNYTKTLSFGVFSDGVGTDGKRTATGYVYYQTASGSNPGTPTATSYQFTTGTFSGLSSGWLTSAPIYSPNNTYWAATYTAVENTAAGNSSSGANLTFSAATQTVSFTGLVTVSSLGSSGTTTIDGGRITTGLVATDRLDTRGLVIRDVSGNAIFSSGVPLAWTNISNSYPSDIANSNIQISSGQLTGIGTGDGTTVANSSIAISNGQLTGIGTGSGTTVANSSITIDATSGQLTGIGTTGNNAIVANSKISLGTSTGNITLNNGVTTTTTALSGAGISAMAYIAKLTSSNLATYMDSGIIGNAFIGNIIASSNFNGTFNETTGVINSTGSVGWAIGKGGHAVLNSVTIRGNITGGTTTGQKVMVGADVGPIAGYHGLSLSESNYTNAFVRNSNTGHVYFNIGDISSTGGISYNTTDSILNIKGDITCRTLTATNLITTGMIQNNQVSNVIVSANTALIGIVWFNDNTTYGYLWPFNTRGLAAGPASITPTSANSKILINWSTQYYSFQHEYNLIEVWRLTNTSGSTWVGTRLYYIGSHSDVNNTAAQPAAFRVRGEEVAAGALVDTTFTVGRPTSYFLVVGNSNSALTYAANPYISLTELKR